MLEHKRTASLYRIALALWYPIGLPQWYLYWYLVRIELLAHVVLGLIYYSPVARFMSFIGFSVSGTRYPRFCLSFSNKDLLPCPLIYYGWVSSIRNFTMSPCFGQGQERFLLNSKEPPPRSGKEEFRSWIAYSIRDSPFGAIPFISYCSCCF